MCIRDSRKADGKEYEETYDKLLLSPGANPVKPPLEGIDSEGIFTLRNVEAVSYTHLDVYKRQEKKYPRSETVDFQRGDVEWEGGNLYFPQWSYHMDIDYLNY